MRKSFHHALLAVLEKSPETCSLLGLATPVQELRPISLGNTDAKTVASDLAYPLVQAVDKLITPTQEGFITVRQLVRNIFRMESFAKVLTRVELQAAMVLLDMEAAFEVTPGQPYRLQLLEAARSRDEVREAWAAHCQKTQ